MEKVIVTCAICGGASLAGNLYLPKTTRVTDRNSRSNRDCLPGLPGKPAGKVEKPLHIVRGQGGEELLQFHEGCPHVSVWTAQARSHGGVATKGMAQLRALLVSSRRRLLNGKARGGLEQRVLEQQ